MITDEKFKELFNEFQDMKKSNIEIKTDIQQIRDALKVIPDISEDLESISSSLAGINSSIKIFITYLTGNSKYLFGGIFIIILVAMGIKEIPNLFK